MTTELDSPAAPPLALPAELSIYTVGPLREPWLAWMLATGDGPAVADAAAVDEIDGAGVQLVLALAQALAREGRHLEIQAPSTRFAAACRTLGLGTLLGDAEAAR